MDKRGECIQTSAYESQEEALASMKQFDLIKFQVTLEKIDNANS